jgi:hypothetical protein
MESKKQTPKYTAEFRERGIRLYREQRPDYTSEFKQVRAAIKRSGGPFECAERSLPGDRLEARLFPRHASCLVCSGCA